MSRFSQICGIVRARYSLSFGTAAPVSQEKFQAALELAGERDMQAGPHFLEITSLHHAYLMLLNRGPAPLCACSRLRLLSCRLVPTARGVSPGSAGSQAIVQDAGRTAGSIDGEQRGSWRRGTRKWSRACDAGKGRADHAAASRSERRRWRHAWRHAR